MYKERENKSENKFRKILQILKDFSFPNSLFPDFTKTFKDKSFPGSSYGFVICGCLYYKFVHNCQCFPIRRRILQLI